MTPPINALRAMLHASLSADAALTALLGGPKIHDQPPRAAAPPYVVLGDMLSRDVSGVDVLAHETIATLIVVSRADGAREAAAVADRIEALLAASDPAIEPGRLVSIAVQSTELRRERGGSSWRALVKLRILTHGA
jgi:hypothetical protein